MKDRRRAGWGWEIPVPITKVILISSPAPNTLDTSGHFHNHCTIHSIPNPPFSITLRIIIFQSIQSLLLWMHSLFSFYSRVSCAIRIWHLQLFLGNQPHQTHCDIVEGFRKKRHTYTHTPRPQTSTHIYICIRTSVFHSKWTLVYKYTFFRTDSCINAPTHSPHAWTQLHTRTYRCICIYIA